MTANLKNKARAQRGCLTRLLNRADNLIEEASESFSPHYLSLLEASSKKIMETAAKVDEAFVALQETDEANYAAHEEPLKEASEKSAKAISKLHRVIREIEARHGAAAAPPASEQTSSKTRLVETLKPFTLQKDHNPLDLRTWINKFRAYYTASHMSSATLLEQQAHFFSCLDSIVSDRIRPQIQEDKPIWGDNGCVKVIEAEFAEWHPLHSRRVEFFRYDQAPGQSVTEWMDQLEKRGAECDLAEGLTEEDIYVMRFYQGIKDTKLRELFFKEDSPSKKDLIRIAKMHERNLLNAKILDASPQVSAMSAYKARKSSKTNNKNESCFRCGGRHGKECPHVNTTCSKCKKKGHIQKVCRSQRTQGQGQGLRGHSISCFQRN